MLNAPLSALAVAAITVAPLSFGTGGSPLGGELWIQSSKLTSDPPVADASLGFAVAASAGRILVGAPGEGAAYIFERGAGGWVQAARLTVTGLPPGARFGDAVALHGDAAFVGAPGVSSVYVFQRGDAGWALAQTLSSDGPPGATRFGASLATDGSRLVVGAPETQTAAGPRAGAVHVFTGVGGALVPEEVLTANLGVPALLGWAVAIHDDWFVAGATRAQAAALFEWRADTWEWTGTVSSTTPNDGFARAVAIGGGVLAVGAPFEHTGDDVQSGAVHVFEHGAAGWARVARLLPDDLSPTEWRPAMGTSLALAPGAGTLLAGAPGDDKTPGLPPTVPDQTDPVCAALGASPTCQGPGAAYVFTRDGQGWQQSAKLTALDALPHEPRQLGRASALGLAVALDPASGLVAAGAPFADFLPGDEAGAAYLFQRLDAGVDA